jgi:pseudouridine synthase
MTNKQEQHEQKGIRINTFIAQAGTASRRGADELIAQGLVRLNGKVLKQPGVRIDPSQDLIEVKDIRGEWTSLSQPEEKIIYIMYKPRGYITSMRPQGRDPIVRKLVPAKPRVFPVGRLDKESEGLLLLTNDGEFAHSLSHPKTHVPKTYIVHCTTPRNYTENMVKSYLGRVAKGVRIEGRRTLPADIRFLRYLRPQMVEIEVTLREGRNRQIRKMLATIHLEVVRLIRTKIGKLSQEDLQLEHGEYRVVERRDLNHHPNNTP